MTIDESIAALRAADPTRYYSVNVSVSHGPGMSAPTTRVHIIATPMYGVTGQLSKQGTCLRDTTDEMRAALGWFVDTARNKAAQLEAQG